ncbi:MAG: putative AAA-ATPase, partial [Gammaproteobacteria bacterium]|nr:putative AAA-ATPase [Gammaproteobacteria bacterium]
MSLIIGQDNFGETVRQQLNFIDKSLFIKEIFDNKEIAVSVIVRPRRFGKTFNMSMLHHFLAAEVNGLKTKNMFDDLKIAQVGETYMKHQGQYPVVFISFKNVKHSNYASTYNGMAKLMSQTYSEHLELLSSQKLNHHQKEIFLSVIEERATQASLQSSLFDLTHALYLHYGVKPWVLIDEYDTPTQAGYLENYYKEIIELMRGLLGSVLKSNANIHRAVITGILRIAKENLFSGLNNVQVFSVLDKEYSEHFGFTEPEVDEALEKNNLYHLSTDIKAWYNGYHIGNTQIYNPWSIANCIFEKGMLQPYWLNTSDNTLIKQTIAHANGLLKIECE